MSGDAAYVGGYLGLILGAVTGALLDQGHNAEEIHQWIDQSIRSYAAAPNDPRTAEAVRLLAEFSGELSHGSG